MTTPPLTTPPLTTVQASQETDGKTRDQGIWLQSAYQPDELGYRGAPPASTARPRRPPSRTSPRAGLLPRTSFPPSAQSRSQPDGRSPVSPGRSTSVSAGSASRRPIAIPSYALAKGGRSSCDESYRTTKQSQGWALDAPHPLDDARGPMLASGLLSRLYPPEVHPPTVPKQKALPTSSCHRHRTST